MKLLKLMSVVCCLAIATLSFGQDAVPAISLKTLDGQTVDIKDYVANGKPVILSFWATWCSPCKKELDAFADLYEDWQADYGVEILAVSIDTRRAAAQVPGIVATKGWEFTVLSDTNNNCQNALNFQTIPQTFLIDGAGKIVYNHNGYVPGDEDELEDKLKALQ